MDPSRPQCKKAKLLRLERKKNKIAQLALPLKLEKTKTAPGAKYLEDFLNEAPSESPAHRLEVDQLLFLIALLSSILSAFSKILNHKSCYLPKICCRL